MNEILIEKVNNILRNDPHSLDCEIETLCACYSGSCYEIYDMVTNGETMKLAKWLVEEGIVTEKSFN